MERITIYAFNVPLVADREALLMGQVVSSNKGIQIGVSPARDAEYVERENVETGDLLWCESNAYYEDDPELLAFLTGEGIDVSEGNPFVETT
jgi:hypothetical protein